MEIVYSIKSKNISAGGLLLIYNREFPKDTILSIGVDLNQPECGAETVKSKILRCQKVNDNIYELGIQFMDISKNMRGCLNKHVQENQDKKPLSDYHQYLENNRIWKLGVSSTEDQ